MTVLGVDFLTDWNVFSYRSNRIQQPSKETEEKEEAKALVVPTSIKSLETGTAIPEPEEDKETATESEDVDATSEATTNDDKEEAKPVMDTKDAP